MENVKRPSQIQTRIKSAEDDDAATSVVRTQPAAESEELFPAGTMLASRYRIIRRLGQGGMGDVYLAEHVDIEREVAIKILATRAKKRGANVERFMQEARSASRIRHKNIVDITDFGYTERGIPFYVMEYLEGVNLDMAIKRGGPMRWPRAKAIMLQILDALQAAHAAGIIHRDMKPENCFILLDEAGEEVAKLLDFGIAKFEEEEEENRLTQTGVIIGTADYMSPEQARSMKLDVRTDIYSSGIILFEMLTGKVPFTAPGVMGLLIKHINEAPPRPRVIAPSADISDRLEAVILKALEKDRALRFQTAREFADALEEVDRPVAEPPPPPLKKRGLSSLTLLAIALLLAIAAAAWVLTLGPMAGTSDAGGTTSERVAASPGDERPMWVPTGITAQASDSGGGDSSVDERTSDAAGDDDDIPDDGATDTDADTDTDTDAGSDSDGTDSDAIIDDPDGRRTKRKKKTPTKKTGALPERLPYAQFRATLNKLRPRASRCRTSGLSPKTVKLHVSISAAGVVENVKYKSRVGTAAFKRCITGTVRAARFGRAQNGQTLGYTFQF